MILFKDEHVNLILRGKKTQTRRVGKKRWNVGAIHLAKTIMLSTHYFCKLKILNVRQERLGDITLEDARKEGHDSIEEYQTIWKWINKTEWDPEQIVWVIDFELVYSDLKPGDIVQLSPECLEYHTYGDTLFQVITKPWWHYGNELVKIENESDYIGAFATKFLIKQEASV